MSFWLYQLLLWLLAPYLVLDLLRRHRQAPSDYRLVSRLGWVKPGLPHNAVWIHAVSLGEVRAALALVRGLQAHSPDLEVVMSTTTETGAQAARKANIAHFYLPPDWHSAQGRVFQRLKPQRLIIMETELWPHLIMQATAHQVPVFIVNARLSDRSFQRYQRWGGALLRDVLSRVIVVAQSAQDQARFAQLGAVQTACCGNIKFDYQASPPKSLPDWGDVPIWLAASTHDDEEQQLACVHRNLQRDNPALRMVVVPRHPERALDVERQMQKMGLSVTRGRLDTMLDWQQNQVFVVEQTGILPNLFAVAQVVFMGGSLVPVGGHNPIEPAAQGQAVITGPYTHNFRAVFAAFKDKQACVQISDLASLEQAIQHALGNRAGWQARGATAYDVVQTNRGAVACVMDVILNKKY